MKDFNISKVYQLADKVLYYEIRDELIALMEQRGKFGILTEYNDDIRAEMEKYPLRFREKNVYDLLYEQIYPKSYVLDIYYSYGLIFQFIQNGTHFIVPFGAGFDETEDVCFIDNEYLKILKDYNGVTSSRGNNTMIFHYRTSKLIVCKEQNPIIKKQMYTRISPLLKYLSMGKQEQDKEEKIQ